MDTALTIGGHVTKSAFAQAARRMLKRDLQMLSKLLRELEGKLAGAE
jgi:hypothetical protein